MKKKNRRDRWRYYFDIVMSKGTASLIGILFGITALVVVISGVIVTIIGFGTDYDFFQSLWVSLMHTIDAGTITADEGGFWYRFIMMLVTICGIFFTSMLIGIINTGLSEKMESLRKGKSIVMEDNHVVILGFDDYTIDIISELVEANSNHKKASIVVMDEEDKTVMEDLIHVKVPDTKTTRIICRSGRIDSFEDLKICSLDSCKSIIINKSEDFLTIKTIMACVNVLEKSGNSDTYVTAMIHNEGNMEVARIAGGGRAEILYCKNVISRIIAHSSRETGISSVFTSLISYDGDEIYVESIEGAEGHTMGDINMYLPESTAIGIVRGGRSLLNPPMDTVIGRDDRLILIAEDDGVTRAGAVPAETDSACFESEKQIKRQPQKILIFGCSSILPQVLTELDNYSEPGSLVIAATGRDDMDGEYLPKESELKNIQLDLRPGDFLSKDIIESLAMERPDNVLILTDPELDSEEADAKTLLLLLHLHSISNRTGIRFSLTSEMRTAANQELAQITHVNDFIISSNITALMMTQIAQTRERHAIFDDLLDESGSEIYMNPVSKYVKCGVEMNFYTLQAAAARYGELAVGYRKRDGEDGYRIVINPSKSDVFSFEEADCVVTIAEN
ncbi:MAG: CASTOR/POLLUX-related putative ion channel [Candidatus Limivicinus sp.]|jgi:K+/H+ antiporter YhaU regulatory subunit KhtT